MKVAVIAPPYPLEEAPAPPLGVTYVAAAFEAAGAEVRVLDYIVSRYSPEKLRRELEAFQPDLVGSTSVTMNFPAAAEIVQAAGLTQQFKLGIGHQQIKTVSVTVASGVNPLHERSDVGAERGHCGRGELVQHALSKHCVFLLPFFSHRDGFIG